MASRPLTDFEHILLGMIDTAPSSGYDLKRKFTATPMGVYQPSSGSLYPALKRLERRNLLRTRAHPHSSRKSGRPRYVYETTEHGRALHLAWVRTPVDPTSIARDLGLHLMRFVMMERLLPRPEVLNLLRSLQDALTAFVTELERYTTTITDGHSRLALDHGIAIHRASIAWTKRTIATLTTSPTTPTEPRPRLPAEQAKHSATGQPKDDDLAIQKLGNRASPLSHPTTDDLPHTPGDPRPGHRRPHSLLKQRDPIRPAIPRRSTPAVRSAEGYADAMPMPKRSSVDDFFAQLNDIQRPHLETLRELSRDADPDAREELKWNLPVYVRGKNTSLWMLQNFKNHCSLRFPPPFFATQKAAVEAAGYEAGQGFIKLPYKRELPTKLLKALLRARVEEYAATGAGWNDR